MNDKLTDCKRCGGNACYEQHINDNATTWLCMGCGFTTSTVMTKDSPAHKNLLDTSPELYKDLLHEDTDSRIWAPATITLPNKGMVFLDGSSKENWGWTAVKAVPLQEGDTKVADNQTHKMDMNNKQSFGQKDFMDACDEIGFFNV